MPQLSVEVKIHKGEHATALDSVIDALAGTSCTGSGFALRDSIRDRSYKFGTAELAESARVRVVDGLAQIKREAMVVVR